MDGLLDLVAAYDGDVPLITFPDGRRLRGDDPGVHDALSAHVGRPVTLAREAEVSHCDDGPVHLVSTAGVAAVAHWLGEPVDVRRFRPNFVVDETKVLQAVMDLNDGDLGVLTRVVCPGRVRVGDVVEVR